MGRSISFIISQPKWLEITWPSSDCKRAFDEGQNVSLCTTGCSLWLSLSAVATWCSTCSGNEGSRKSTHGSTRQKSRSHSTSCTKGVRESISGNENLHRHVYWVLGLPPFIIYSVLTFLLKREALVLLGHGSSHFFGNRNFIYIFTGICVVVHSSSQPSLR